jgi:hypothetical protein
MAGYGSDGIGDDRRRHRGDVSRRCRDGYVSTADLGSQHD